MADRIGALIEYLEAWPGLSGIPINAPRLKTSQAASMPTECVVLTQVGGFGELVDMLLYHQRVEVKAYGKTARSASTLHDTCMLAMLAINDKLMTDGVVLWSAELEIGAVDDVEASTNQSAGANSMLGWPFTYSTWGLVTILETEGSD